MSKELTVEEMLHTLGKLPGRNIHVSKSQEEVIRHEKGPLWIIAGPGSGKTEALVLRCLKLLLVDRVNPRAIMITTFTEKAGRNLRDRLILYTEHIRKDFAASVKDVDITQLRVGTLHSLCNDILLEYRYPGYRNFRPMDDMEQLLFIYFHSDLASRKNKLTCAHKDFFAHFLYMFDKRSQNFLKAGYIPSRWARARVAQGLFNRIVQYRTDMESMISKGGVWKTLANEFLEYEEALSDFVRVDFAHMQSKLLDFLETPHGKLFLKGEAKPDDPGLSHILVDEYQDTNPIQTEIYFRLASETPHNLVVVGDDDQSLYRFRGATVESMINFDKMCGNFWETKPRQISLVENYRSHPEIVNWCNEFIKSFKTMKKPGARVAGKPPLVAMSSISGNWPAVRISVSRKVSSLANHFANAIEWFRTEKIITKYSDCALLIHSTRETGKWAGPFAEALREKDIPFYNPRSRQFLEHEEIMLALGALLSVIDANGVYPLTPDYIQKECNRWRDYYEVECSKYKSLREYVGGAIKKISSEGLGNYLPSNLQDVLYHVLNHEPFVTWATDPERGVRLGYLTSIFEAYTSTPVPGYPGLSRGTLRMSRSQECKGELSWMWRHQFYNALVTLMLQQGINDPEDEEVMYPSDSVPFMTVHQAKGLEFPIVFVAKPDEKAKVDSSVLIEQEMQQFRKSYIVLSDPADRSRQDLIRFYYVAYSRAQYILFILLRSDEINPGEQAGQQLGLGGGKLSWLKNRVGILEV